MSVIISNQIAKKEPIDLQPEEVVRRLQEDYPGWQDKLFACPCTRPPAKVLFSYLIIA
ncbi:MAG: hypothetical protein IM479_01460 [Microcystis sp. M165S2]|nr:hypothetical protein [Microcystis sp. M087S2]MCA2687239.1 hypothetical protein [Microcystis sp. M037S2]MCA2736997.1 hypothetical protein [Microcystis sp. M165S2]